MKKIIAVIVALAMVLSMSVMAFAEFNEVKSPSDISESRSGFDDAVNNPLIYPQRYNEIRKQGIYTKDDNSLMTWDEAWQAYYAYVLANAASDPVTAISEIGNIISEGYLEIGDIIGIAGATLMGGIGGDGEEGDMSGIIDGILGTLGGLFDSDAEPQISAEEYAQELAQMINDGAGIDEISAKIGDDLASGKIVISQLPDIAAALSDLVELGEIEDNETLQELIAFLEGLGGDGNGDGGFQFPDFGDFTLPWDSDNSSSGSFLDTLLGILGSIGDLLFGGSGDGEGDDPGFDWGEGDGLGDIFGGGDGDTTVIPDTGDVSFIAVAAVAAVAGAALVLTRKKSDDAE